MDRSLLKNCLTVLSVFFMVASCDRPQDVNLTPQKIIVKGKIIVPAGAHRKKKNEPPANKISAPPEQKENKDTLKKDGKVLAPDESTPEPEYYNPKGKIDPFTPLFNDSPDMKIAEKGKRKRQRTGPKGPLEMIELSQLKLTAITNATSGNRALMEEVSGKGYIIKKGMFIGKNSGKVLEIFLDRLVVEEEIEDYSGNYIFQKKEIKLLKPDGE